MYLLKLKASSLAITLLLLVAGTSAQAQTIFGGYDCGQWTQRARINPMQSWVSGYLSGLNSMHVFQGLKPNDPLVLVFDTASGDVKIIPVGKEPHGLTVWPQPGRYSLGHTGNLR